MFLIASGLVCADTRISEEKIAASRNWLEKGKSLSRSGKQQDAIKAYNKAIELNPRLDKAYNNRNNVYFDKQEYDKAIDDYTRAITLNPRFDKAYYNRGIAYRLTQQSAKADENFKKANDIIMKYGAETLWDSEAVWDTL